MDICDIKGGVWCHGACELYELLDLVLEVHIIIIEPGVDC